MRGLVAAFLAFVLHIAVQAVLFHLVHVRRKLATMLMVCLAGVAVYAAAYERLPDDLAYLPRAFAAASDWVNWLNGAFVYWGLFAGYYQFVNMADNSVGVRSLIELERGPATGLTLRELEPRYQHGWMLGHRLDRLVVAGFLEKMSDGRYRCTHKGARLARVFWALKRLLGLGPGG